MSASARPLSRRTALAAAGLAAAAVGLEACSTKAMPSNVPLTKRTPGVRHDIEVLGVLLDRERYAIAAYSAAIPLLSKPAARAATQFLSHELAHAVELEGLITQAGAKPAKPPAFYDLGNPRTEREVLELLHAAERAQVDAYLQAVGRLVPARLRAAAVAILANEAQHMAVLRSQLGLAPVPSALVGTRE